MLTLVLQENLLYCTPEYFVWILKDAKRVDLDRGGRLGYKDLEKRDWAHNLLNKDYHFTPDMREQIILTYESLHI